MIINKTVCDKDRTDCNGSGYFVSTFNDGSVQIVPSKDMDAKQWGHHYCGIGCLTQALPVLLEEAKQCRDNAAAEGTE